MIGHHHRTAFYYTKCLKSPQFIFIHQLVHFFQEQESKGSNISSLLDSSIVYPTPDDMEMHSKFTYIRTPPAPVQGNGTNNKMKKGYSLFARFRHLRGESQSQICVHCVTYAVRHCLSCVPISLNALHASGTGEIKQRIRSPDRGSAHK